MSDGLAVLLYVVSIPIFSVRTGLLSAVSFGVLVSVSLSTAYVEHVSGIHPRIPAECYPRFVGIVLLAVLKRADEVLRSTGDINLSCDTVNDILPSPFLVFYICGYTVLRLCVLVLFVIAYLFQERQVGSSRNQVDIDGYSVFRPGRS